MNVLFTPCLWRSVMLPRLGRIKAVIVSYIFLISGLLMLALSKQFTSNSIFIFLTCFGRLLEGVGINSAYPTLTYMASSYYSDYAPYVTIIYVGINISDVLGPSFAGLMFPLLHYSGVFLLIAGLCLIAALLTLTFRRFEAQATEGLKKETVGYC